MSVPYKQRSPIGRLFWWLRCFFMAAAVLSLLALATHPWWLSWVAQRILEGQGLTVEQSTTRGYRELVWEGVQWELDEAALEADRLVITLPFAWVSTLLSMSNEIDPEKALLRVYGWRAVVNTHREGDDQERVEEPLPPGEWIRRLQAVLTTVRKVLPTAVAEDGRLSAAPTEWVVDRALWAAGVFEIEAREEALPSPGRFSLKARQTPSGMALSGASQDPAWPWILEGRIVVGEDGFQSFLQVQMEDLKVEGRAQWGNESWIPRTGEMRAKGERVPLPLAEGIPDLQIARLDIESTWTGPNLWTLSGRGAGSVRDPDSGRWVPLSTDIRAEGDFERILVHEASIDSRFMLADLTLPLRINWPARSVESETEFSVVADLRRLPGKPIDARFDGTIKVAPGAGPTGLWADLQGHVEGSWEGFEGSARIEGSGFVDEVSLDLDQLTVWLPRGSIIEASGWYEFVGRRAEAAALTFDLVWEDFQTFEGVTDALPERIQGSITASGEWPNLQHVGNVQVERLKIPRLEPVRATAHWTGVGIEAVDLKIEAGLLDSEQELRADVSVSEEDQEFVVGVKALQITDLWGAKVLAELEPVSIEIPTVIVAPKHDGAQVWAIRWTPLSIRLPGELSSAINISSGEFSPNTMRLDGFGIRNLDIPWLEGWIEASLPDIRIAQASFEVETTEHGGLTGRGRLDGGFLYLNSEYQLSFDFHFGGDGIHFGRGSARLDAHEVFSAQGSLPVVLSWAEGAVGVGVDYFQPLDLKLKADRMSGVGVLLEEFLNVELEGHEIDLAVSGTLRRPVGSFNLQVDRLSYSPTEAIPLDLERVHLSLTMEGRRAEVHEAQFAMRGVPETAQLTASLENINWEKILAGGLREAVEELSGRVGLQRFPFAAVSAFAPDLFEPRGQVAGTLHVHPGPEVTGEVVVTGVSLRPFEEGSSLREINASVAFAGAEVHFDEVHAMWNGRPVALGGRADLSTWPNPVFSLSVKGENLDLVRRSELLLRSDVDVTITREVPEAPPLVSGHLALRDSLFLQDLRDLIRPGAAGVRVQPPYFSVNQEPFRTWRLNISASGEDFLRLQSTVLRGTLSAAAQLGGTLGQPLLLGEASVDGGAIVFPFGRIELSQAEAIITIDRPHALQLFAQGSGHTFGHTINLHLGGTASRPTLELNSVPPLGQDAILLMLAAGTVHESEAGGAGARTGRVALFIGQDILSVLLGSEGGGNIRIRTGESSSQFGAEATSVEYILNERFSVIGEYNEYEDYNIDLKWRVFRK